MAVLFQLCYLYYPPHSIFERENFSGWVGYVHFAYKKFFGITQVVDVGAVVKFDVVFIGSLAYACRIMFFMWLIFQLLGSDVVRFVCCSWKLVFDCAFTGHTLQNLWQVKPYAERLPTTVLLTVVIIQKFLVVSRTKLCGFLEVVGGERNKIHCVYCTI